MTRPRPFLAAPGALSEGDRRRLHGLLLAGAIDSTGLAFGWTVFTLAVAAKEGLAAAADYQAAMLLGVALSAPFTRWVTARVDGRKLLRGVAVSEGACRVAVLLLLLAGAPSPVLVASVVAMNVLAWTGYAAMRAEVTAVEPGSVLLTQYGVCIAGAEALAAAAAACLVDPTSRTAIALAIPLYAMSLIPQWSAAAAARVPRHTAAGSVARAVPLGPPRGLGARLRTRIHRDWRAARPWTGGGLVMLAASGPVLLASVLAYHYYGRPGVAISAVALTAGALLSPHVSARLDRLAARGVAFGRPAVVWPLLGMTMIAGWCLAPASIAGLGVAQVMAGMALTTFEGTMDNHCARNGGASGITSRLSAASASRALGGAAAVALLPLLLHRIPLGVVVGGAAVLLLSAGGAGLLVRRRLPPPAGSHRRKTCESTWHGAKTAEMERPAGFDRTRTGPSGPRPCRPVSRRSGVGRMPSPRHVRVPRTDAAAGWRPRAGS